MDSNNNLGKQNSVDKLQKSTITNTTQVFFTPQKDAKPAQNLLDDPDAKSLFIQLRKIAEEKSQPIIKFIDGELENLDLTKKLEFAKQLLRELDNYQASLGITDEALIYNNVYKYIQKKYGLDEYAKKIDTGHIEGCQPKLLHEILEKFKSFSP